MPITDMPLAELQTYLPTIDEPQDFDAFWAATLTESRDADRGYTLTPVDTPIRTILVEDLTFSGYNGEPIKAWVTRPVGATGPLPAVVEFQGYNGGRGLPGERIQWAASGYVHVFMDTRGQGSGWGTGGSTPDPYGSGPAVAGFMTKGIENPQSYYYRRVFTDAARLVETAMSFDFVDAQRVAVTGGSQGGGIAIAAAALVPQVRAVMPDVPFLCHFRRGVELTPSEPFTEVTRYLSVHRDSVESVFETLSYFDGANFAKRIRVPAYFSVGLMDPVVLPSTVFAAYNSLAATDRRIEVYAFNGHEGGAHRQWLRQAEWLPSRLA